MKYYKLLFIYFLLQSCDVSTITDEEMKNLNNLRVFIQIEDGDKANSLRSIRVFLSDGKKKIINDKITILMNRIPMRLYVKDELYYTKRSYYVTDSLSRKDSYYFEIILPDSLKYPLAYIKPLKRNTNASFKIPKKHPKDENLQLEWENINWTNHFEIWKLVHQKNQPNVHGGGRYDKSTIHESIKTESGKYVVPKSFFKDSLTIADFIELRISSTESGLINPELIKSSTITYTFVKEETIELEESINLKYDNHE